MLHWQKMLWSRLKGLFFLSSWSLNVFALLLLYHPWAIELLCCVCVNKGVHAHLSVGSTYDSKIQFMSMNLHTFEIKIEKHFWLLMASTSKVARACHEWRLNFALTVCVIGKFSEGRTCYILNEVTYFVIAVHRLAGKRNLWNRMDLLLIVTPDRFPMT